MKHGSNLLTLTILFHLWHLMVIQYYILLISLCSGSVVVTAYDFESGRPGSNPEWGLIYY